MTQTVKEEETDPVKDDKSKDIALSDTYDFNFDEIVSKSSFYVNTLLNFEHTIFLYAIDFFKNINCIAG